MPTTPVYGWPYDATTDRAQGPGQMQRGLLAVENTLVVQGKYLKTGSVVVSCNSSGYGTVAFAQPYPTSIVTVIACNGDGSSNADVHPGTLRLNNFDIAAFLPSGAPAANALVRVNYLAFGN